MKMCPPHWTALRAAISARGLDVYIPDGGAAAAAKMQSQQAGLTLSNFEPLMGAHMMLVGQLLEAVGPAVLAQDDCPICFGNMAHRAGCTDTACGFSFDLWIERAADAALAELQRLRQEAGL